MSILATIQCKNASPHRQDIFGTMLIDYSLDKPFEAWPEGSLLKCLDAALAEMPMNLEISTLIVNELKGRGVDIKRVRKTIEKLEGQEIPWLIGSRYRVESLMARFKPSDRYPKNCKVYFILLTVDRNTPEPWGIYIGQTSKKIENRLAVHFDENSMQGSNHVRERGWQILYSLSNLVPPMTLDDSEKFEGHALGSFRGYLNNKCLRKLPSKKVRGGGPEKYRVKNPKK
jgi:hypothetical protein